MLNYNVILICVNKIEYKLYDICLSYNYQNVHHEV